ncbi:MAG: hypothetical protein ACRDQ7_01810, partial [Haloechinothrix sp.]
SVQTVARPSGPLAVVVRPVAPRHQADRAWERVAPAALAPPVPVVPVVSREELRPAARRQAVAAWAA